MIWTYFSAAAVLLAVAAVAYFYSRGKQGDDRSYFLAGRALPGAFIAGSLLLTNISAEQLIGLSGSAYAHNLSSMAWEVTATIAIIFMALVLLPRYLASGFTTLPQFLEQRFDARVRRLSAVLFVVGYSLITLPSVLYAGSLAVLTLTGVDIPLLALMAVIAAIGCAFAVGGGLRAIAISDSLFGVGLLLIGFAVPVLGLIHLGDGQFMAGLDRLTADHPEKLNAIGAADDPTPFGTLFTGMVLANLFYWGTNQYVIQRTLGARNLAAGQQGVLIAGFFKLCIPLFVMVPGIIAFHLYGGDELITMDAAYPALVRDVLPEALAGVFLAVLLGVVISSFNSLINSAATILTLDLFPRASVSHVFQARLWTLTVTLIAVAMAPQLANAPEGLWQLIRKFTGFYNIPVITLVLAALFLPRASPQGALAATTFHIVAYGLTTFVWDTGLHFIHLYGVLFLIEVAILTLWRPRSTTARSAAGPASEGPIDMTPWRWRWWVSGGLAAGVVGLYALFSPLGLAG